MSAPPPLTIAIPFFDEEQHIGDAVRSTLGQTMPDFELLLVDDGSRDRSLEIAHAFRDSRVRVISDGRHLGLAARLNEIVRRARSELVARMDADDVAHPTRIERQLALLRSSGADVVGTWAGLFDGTERVFAVMESAPLPPTPRSALERGILVHATMLARRAWFQAHPYDEALTHAEDRDLWCRTAERATFAVVKEPLYAVRVDVREPDFGADYAAAQRVNRDLVLRYGPGAVGLVRTAELWLAAHAKERIMRVAARAGWAGRLVRRRGRPPTERERLLVEEALRSAREARGAVAHLLEHDLPR